MTVENPKKLNANDIPSTFYNVEINDKVKEALIAKKEVQFKSVLYPNGVCRSVSLSLIEEEGKEKLFVRNLDDELFIGNDIAGYKLSKRDVDKLKAHEEVTVLYNNVPVKLQLDKNNNIYIKFPNKINLEKGFGGKQLSKEDIELLKTNKTLSTRVFNNDGRYFSANLSLTPDGNGWVIKNMIYLSKEEALKLEKTIQTDKNFPQTVDIKENVKENSFIKQAEPIKEPMLVKEEIKLKKTTETEVLKVENEKQVKPAPELTEKDKQVLKLIENNDASFVKDLSLMMKTGDKPSEALKEKVSSGEITSKLTPENKTLLAQYVGIEYNLLQKREKEFDLKNDPKTQTDKDKIIEDKKENHKKSSQDIENKEPKSKNGAEKVGHHVEKFSSIITQGGM